MTRKWVVGLVAVLLLLPALAAGQAGTTVVDVVSGNSQLHTFESALAASGLAEMLRGAGPFTVFAPSDAAFRALPIETLEALNSDPDGALRALVRRHVVRGEFTQNDLVELDSVRSDLGEDLLIGATADGLVINRSADVIRVLTASNGVIFIVDAVLFPVPASAAAPAASATVQQATSPAVPAAPAVEMPAPAAPVSPLMYMGDDNALPGQPLAVWHEPVPLPGTP
jgi:uncharacterized surface protein with fasciclin (FAS1) repeats